jgi:hypothetical protein
VERMAVPKLTDVLHEGFECELSHNIYDHKVFAAGRGCRSGPEGVRFMAAAGDNRRLEI